MDSPDPTNGDPRQIPAHAGAELQLLHELTRLSKSLVDLTAVTNRQLSLIVALQHENASLRQGFGELRHEVEEVRVSAQLGVRGHESSTSSELRERLVWYPAWSAQAPLSGEPLVSVIIPTRNRRPLLEAALDSLLGQTYGNWEAVVVDDASNDDTAEFVRGRAASDSRLKLIEADGNGSAAARQRGLGASTGELVAYLDDDNLMANGWLRAVAELFGRRLDVDVAYGAQIRSESTVDAPASEPHVLFEPFDEIRLTEGNYIDTGVIAHRAGLGVEHPSWVRGVDDWRFVLDLAEQRTPHELPVIASIYLPFATERESRRPDQYRSEEDVRSHSARRRRHDDRFVTAALRSTRSASSHETNSLLPTMTRLDGEILVLVLIALSRRCGNSLRVLGSGVPNLEPALERLLQSAGIHTDWQHLEPDQNPLADSDLHRAVHVALIAGDVSRGAPAAMRSRLDDDGFVLVHQNNDTTAPVFDDFATVARIGHRLWIASPVETDLARVVPLRGLIEGDSPTEI